MVTWFYKNVLSISLMPIHFNSAADRKWFKDKPFSNYCKVEKTDINQTIYKESIILFIRKYILKQQKNVKLNIWEF
jgi:hypothetical protein